MTIDQILNSRPYMRWQFETAYQLSNYETLHELLTDAYKMDIFVPADWIEPLQGYVLVSNLNASFKQGERHFAYRIL